MADRALILSCDNYTIPDEKTGVVNNIVQLWYINDYREASETELGSKPIKMLTTPEMFLQLRGHNLPALFDMELRSRPGKANAAALTVVGVKFVRDVNLFEVDPIKKAA
jgi:hypothetical protein